MFVYYFFQKLSSDIFFSKTQFEYLKLFKKEFVIKRQMGHNIKEKNELSVKSQANIWLWLISLNKKKIGAKNLHKLGLDNLGL